MQEGEPRRRVVVTGLGLISPLGGDVESSWAALRQGKSGIGPITRFDPTGLETTIAGEVKDFDPLTYLDRKEMRRTDRISFRSRYVRGSKSFTSPAIVVSSPVGSNRVIGPMPLLPCRRAAHDDSTSPPSGEMRPRPVTTTRLRGSPSCIALRVYRR